MRALTEAHISGCGPFRASGWGPVGQTGATGVTDWNLGEQVTSSTNEGDIVNPHKRVTSTIQGERMIKGNKRTIKRYRPLAHSSECHYSTHRAIWNLLRGFSILSAVTTDWSLEKHVLTMHTFRRNGTNQFFTQDVYKVPTSIYFAGRDNGIVKYAQEAGLKIWAPPPFVSSMEALLWAFWILRVPWDFVRLNSGGCCFFCLALVGLRQTPLI